MYGLALGPTQPPIRGLFPELKRLDLEADHLRIMSRLWCGALLK